MAIACGDATRLPLAPSVSAAPSAVTGDAAALRIAVDDGLQRLLPGVSADAARPIGDALHNIDAALRHTDSHSTALERALADADQALRRFSGADRADRATLDALELELSVAPRP
jgi:hypothetical protein